MPAIVVLPGMDGSAKLRDAFVGALGPDFETIVVSYPVDHALGYSELESLARSFLPQDQPYLVLGESFSGPIAISIAASYPPGLLGVVLSCSFAKNPLPFLASAKPLVPWLPFRHAPISLLSAVLLGRFGTAPLRSALKEAVTMNSDATLRARARAVLDVDVSPELARLRMPLLYLRGSEDRLVPRSCSEAIVRAAPHARIVEIEAPHFLLQAVPSAAAAAVRDFATRIVPRAAHQP
jgi:pimeloyl-ACP methyl ester carboxylesterase